MKSLNERLAEIQTTSLRRELEKDIVKYSNNAIDYKFNSIVKGELIFAIGYSKIVMQSGGEMGIYRMVCASIGGTILYENGNVIDYDKMYSIDTVIQQTKSYFKHYSSKLELL